MRNNDEAYKMALTDARRGGQISGRGCDIYFEKFKEVSEERKEEEEREQKADPP